MTTIVVPYIEFKTTVARVKLSKALRDKINKTSRARVRAYLKNNRIISKFERLLEAQNLGASPRVGVDSPRRKDAARLLKDAHEARIKIDEENKRRIAWKQREKINTNRLTRQWKDRANKSNTNVIDNTITALALVEGVTKANDAFNLGLGMPDVELNIKQASVVADKLFNIRFAVDAINQFNFDPSLKEKILDRIVAREFPYTDANRSNEKRLEAELTRKIEAIKENRVHETLDPIKSKANT